MRSLVVLAALWAGLMAATPPASAQPATSAFGRLWCDHEDELVRIAIASGVEGGMGNAAFNFRGTLEILDKEIAEDLRKTEFDGRHLAQYWLDEFALRLHLYRERQGEGPHGYIDLIIYLQAGDDEPLYGGSYDLTVFDMTGHPPGEGKTVKYSDPINCFAQ